MQSTEQARSARREKPRSDGFFSQVIENGSRLDLSNRSFVRVLFRGCSFSSLKNAHFVRCVFENCALDSDDVREALSVTATLNCDTFDGVRFSPAILDALVYLVTRGAEESEQRRLRCGIGEARCRFFDKMFPEFE